MIARTAAGTATVAGEHGRKLQHVLSASDLRKVLITRTVPLLVRPEQLQFEQATLAIRLSLTVMVTAWVANELVRS
jgi:hypothetical protein